MKPEISVIKVQQSCQLMAGSVVNNGAPGFIQYSEEDVEL